MASPFRIFRKHQRLLLALLTIMTVISFSFGYYITDILGLRSRGPVNEIVASTSQFGSLKQSDVNFLRQDRMTLLAVMTEIFELKRLPPRQARFYAEQIFGLPTEESLVNSWLLMNYAQQRGIVVSDDAINQLLQAITNDEVSSDDIQAIFRRAGLSANQFFSLLRYELLAHKAEELFQTSTRLDTATPAQRWDYFNRVQRYATIEAVAVPVSNYLKDVAKPSDEQLKTFFEKHKNRAARPDSPEPGFYEPQRIALEYVGADIEKFTKAITDKQVNEEYEKNKAKYDDLLKKLAPEKPATEPAKKPAQEKKPVGQPEKKPAQPAKHQPANETKSPAKPAAQPSKPEQKPAAPKKTSQNSTPRPMGEGQGLRAESPIQLAAYATDKKDEKKPDAKANAAKPVAPAPSATKPQTTAAKPKTALTDQVKTAIRRDLAAAEVRRLFNELKDEVSDYASKWDAYHVASIRAEDQHKKIGPPPAPPKFDDFAKKHGLTLGHTDLVAQWDLQATNIGQSIVTGNGVLLWRYAFQKLPKFRCETAMDFKGDVVYLFWMTDDQKEHTPEFKNVRGEVLRQWQLIHARDIALKAANKLAADARKADKPLKQAFAERPEYHVVLPGKFSWLNFPNIANGWRQPARLSNVDGIPMVGWDFMREVFGLQKGQVGVAFNAPKTVAYVIRPTDFSPSYEVLLPIFETESYEKYARAGERDMIELKQAWFDGVKKSVGFAWGPGHKLERTSDDRQAVSDMDEE